MKKSLLCLLGILVVFTLAAVVVAPFILGSIVEAGVNQIGPRVTQSSVELEGASISPLSGVGTLTGLTVGNPKGWSNSPAFHLGRIQFDLAPSSLFGDTIVVNDLTVEQPEFGYETHLFSSNISDLLKNIESVAGTGADQPAGKNAKPRKFIVKHFQLQNGKVSVGVGPAALPLALPPLELKDLGVKEGGLTSGQLAVAVISAVLPNLISATTNAAAKLGGTIGAAAGESVQKLFGGKK